ncbi:hypothetical protein ACHAXT_010825 [Thalassiosira profunda]
MISSEALTGLGIDGFIILSLICFWKRIQATVSNVWYALQRFAAFLLALCVILLVSVETDASTWGEENPDTASNQRPTTSDPKIRSMENCAEVDGKENPDSACNQRSISQQELTTDATPHAAFDEEVQQLQDSFWGRLPPGLKETIESVASKPISEDGICEIFLNCMKYLALVECLEYCDDILRAMKRYKNLSVAFAGALLLEHRDNEAAYLLYYGSFVGEILTSGPTFLLRFLDTRSDDSDDPLKQLCDHFYQFHGVLLDTETRGRMLHVVHGWTEGNPTLGSLRDELGEAIKRDTVSSSSKTLHNFSDKLPLSNNPHHGKTIKLCIQNSDDGTVREVFQSYNHVPLCWVLRVYSAEKGLSRKHWCIHQGRTLFVKSAGTKTLGQLGIVSGDVIKVGGDKAAASSVPVKEAKPKGKSKKKSRQAAKRKKRATKSTQSSEPSEKELRERHSVALQPVLDELSPQLKSIRDRLSGLAIKKTVPKNRGLRNVTNTSAIESAPCLPDESLGKAGIVCYSVLAGEETNLYLTHKPCSTLKRLHVDLHGCSRAEALDKLNEALPQWVDTAMRGEHPFVVPVDIVCGGGAQILSGAVRGWIKRTRQVANRPKRY